MKRRVVVTGLGMLSPLGNSIKESWDGILAGKSGVSRINSFDVSAFGSQISGSVKNLNPKEFLSPKTVRRTDTFIQYGLIASAEALKDSGLVVNEHNSYRVGVAIGSGIGGLPGLENSHSILLEKGPKKLSPFFIPGIVINMIFTMISRIHDA